MKRGAARSGATVRLVDVAARAGVSPVTVAKVLNDSGGATVRVGAATRARVLAIADRLGYRPNRIAQQLRGARSRVLGVIVDSVHLELMARRLVALEDRARARGYRLLVGQARRNPSGVGDYLGDFVTRGVEAVVCLFDPIPDGERTLRRLFRAPLPIPTVFHSRPLGPGGRCVRVDAADGMRQNVEHLLSRGRRRVGIALWNRKDQLALQRVVGYRRALEAAGVRFDPALVCWPLRPGPEPTPETFEEIVDRLVVRQRVDAIAATNDQWAARLVQRLRARGYRVPDDVALTGYDNLEMCELLEPPLTTIDQEHEAYADAVVALALGEHAPGETERVIRPRLVVRRSSG